MRYTVERVESLEEFRELEDSWDALARDAGHPFALHAWIEAWLSAFAAEMPVAIYTAWDGELLAAAVPLVRRGAMLSAAANAHTPWFSPLGEAAPLALVGDAVARSGASHVVLPELALDDASTAVLTEALDRCRAVVWVEPARSAPVIDRATVPHEYLSHLSGDRRREVRRLGRRLGELGAVVTPLARPTDVDADVDRALALEASGWKGRRGTAIVDDPATERFYRAVAHAFTKRDELRLSTVTLEGELVAFDLCIVANGRLWIPKGSIDERHRRLSPGIVLLVAEIEAAFDDGASGVELLGDADAYKLPFATRTRRHGIVHGARLRPAPVLRVAYRRTLRPRLREVARSFRRR